MNPSISPRITQPNAFIQWKSCWLSHSYRLLSTGEVYSSPADYIQIDRQLQNMQNLQFHNSYYTFWQRGLHSSGRPEEQSLLSLNEQICEKYVYQLSNFVKLWWILEWITTKDFELICLVWLRIWKIRDLSISDDIWYT